MSSDLTWCEECHGTEGYHEEGCRTGDEEAAEAAAEQAAEERAEDRILFPEDY